MFDLKTPCSNCPFRKGMGENYGLGVERCLEIFNSTAFQCHKTVDYDQWDDPRKRQGQRPQQCAGVISLLHRANLPNQIMRVAERTGHCNFDDWDHSQAYATIDQALEAHSWGRRWDEELIRHRAPRLVKGEPTRGRMTDFVRAWEFRQPYDEGPL